MARCPQCQHESVGRFFCERCHHLLPVTIQPAVPESVRLPDGHFVDCSGWHGVWPADAWAPRAALWGGRPCRVYAINRGWWPDLAPGVERRASVCLDVLAPVAFVPVADAAIVVAAALPGARPALLEPDPPGADPFTRLDAALTACRLLERALGPLHAAGLVWLGFDPAELDIAGDRLVVRGLDLYLHPAGACPPAWRRNPAYATPEACASNGEAVGPATDVFHVCLYLYYRLAGLLPTGFPGDGVEAFDFDFPPLRIYRPELPPGITAVLERGLRRDPSARFASMADLSATFDAAVSRARARRASTTAVAIDPAGGSAIGLTHELTGVPNQDGFSIASLGPDALLAIVADGVSQATVGSGDRASRITVALLADRLPALLGAGGSVRAALAQAFLETSDAVLADALAGHPLAGVEPVDVMSSTALVGVVRGNELTLASVGDSRAYLVADGVAEQLTVDGDVRCVELAGGLPPEQVRRIGAEAWALYTCLGVGEHDPAGRLVVSPERSRPAVTRLTLLPGDVVVLCTDGLVEEGAFLSPGDVARLVGESPTGPAAALVEVLIREAKRCQRPPSPAEPQGCGDDITCVVLVVQRASGPTEVP